MELLRLLILMSLGLPGMAMTQSQSPHVCGAGAGPNEVMAGTMPGGNGMAPTPLCYWNVQAQNQGAPPQPTGWWEKTWGAIAPSPVGGVLGVATGASSKEEAEQLALADCEAKGGGACEVDISYYNQCAAMVLGDKVFNTSHAASTEIASSLGLKQCEEESENCRVYYSACTEPIFHSY